jgi:quercetin dioxygenase-like cupin family protein
MKGQPPADLPAMRSQFAVVEGDPSKAGSSFVVRIKAPDGEKVPPHWHPTDEHLTVLQGTFVLADGEKYSDGGTELKAGSYVSVPRHMWHHGHIKGETILQIHGMGPFTMNLGPLPK